jgi:hypothetical protein
VQPNTRSFLLVPVVLQAFLAQPAAAQGRGALTIHYGTIAPIIALLAGVLILIRPRLLNYVVAIYLILIGLIGILGV